MTLFGVLGQRGQHAVLYGERGVGKTSLANILGDSFTGRMQTRIRPIRYNCTTKDDFASLWRGIFRKLGESEEMHEVTTDRILETLERQKEKPLIIIDEVDRFLDNDGLSLLADTIKALSDQAVPATIVLVGVADSIDQLIGDHRSVERALIQVKMPRMSMKELLGIMDKGLEKLNLTIDGDAKRRIARLSEGLPSITHLLAFHAASAAILDDREAITSKDVEYAIKNAVKKGEQSILTDYSNATRSPRKDNLFAEVLLACALAEKNELGYFAAGEVRGPMSRITQRPIKISAFVRHLNGFCSSDRGQVLQKHGQPRKYFYRFSNPIMQPYVIIRGLTEGLLTETVLEELRPMDSGEQEPDLFQ